MMSLAEHVHYLVDVVAFGIEINEDHVRVLGAAGLEHGAAIEFDSEHRGWFDVQPSGDGALCFDNLLMNVFRWGLELPV